MSGGSLNYEYSKETPSLGAYERAADEMRRLFAQEMQQNGGGSAYTVHLLGSMRELAEHLLAAQRIHDDPRMKRCMRAIEWMLSGDYDDAQALEECREAYA